MTSNMYTIKQYVERELKAVERFILELADTHASFLIPQISQYIMDSGGKRIRPIMTLVFAKMLGYVGEDHIKLAACVEFIHTATLLHDDVIDESKTRRGKKTANQIWSNKPSILVGDFLFSQAFKLMVSTGNMRALKTLSNAAATIAAAEVLQVEMIADLNLSMEQYISLIREKTAVLFAAACEVGAVLGGEEKDIIMARQYGLSVGIIFQIIDDVLDYFGMDAKFGKIVGNDLRERKVTLPLILLMQEDKQYSNMLEAMFAQPQVHQKQFDVVFEALCKYRIKDRCIEVAKKYSAIDALGGDPVIAEVLMKLLDEMLDRSY